MNRSITATSSHVRLDHPFTRHQSIVVDVPSLYDQFGISKKVSTSRFRGAGLEDDVVPVSYVPVFTPPRMRVRMRTESIFAIFGGIVAAGLIIGSAWIMIKHKKNAVKVVPSAGTHHEMRLFNEDSETTTKSH